MAITFSDPESRALYAMLAEGGPDIVLRLDHRGTILESSSAIERLVGGCGAANAVETLADIVEVSHRPRVTAALFQAVEGSDAGWVEFPAINTDARESWFEIRCRALPPQHEGDASLQVLAILRSVDERRMLRDQLFAATYSDALTGLSNRKAFVLMLESMLARGIEGSVALFSIDFFKAINLRFGQQRGDAVLCDFADLLRETLREEDVIARIGSERFAVLLPRTAPDPARTICNRVLTRLGRRRPVLDGENIGLTASGSVVCIANSIDSTLQRAEVALFSARTKGRNRLEGETSLASRSN